MNKRIKIKETPRTDEDTQNFVAWYKWMYGDTSEATGTGQLPTIEKREEKLHVRIWKRKIRFALGNWANRQYIHKGWRKDTQLWRYYSELYLWYFPKVLDNNLGADE